MGSSTARMRGGVAMEKVLTGQLVVYEFVPQQHACSGIDDQEGGCKIRMVVAFHRPKLTAKTGSPDQERVVGGGSYTVPLVGVFHRWISRGSAHSIRQVLFQLDGEGRR